MRRTVGCACGYRAQGRDDDELRGLIRSHVDRAHPEFAYTDRQIDAWVASAARDAVATGPFGPANPRKEVVKDHRRSDRR